VGRRHHNIFEISDELLAQSAVATTADQAHADSFERDDPRSAGINSGQSEDVIPERVTALPASGPGQGGATVARRRWLLIAGGAVVAGVAGITSTLLPDRAGEPTGGAATPIQGPARVMSPPTVTREGTGERTQRPTQWGEPDQSASNRFASAVASRVGRVRRRSRGLGAVPTSPPTGQAKTNDPGHEFSFER
jgi:hypothetical protein